MSDQHSGPRAAICADRDARSSAVGKDDLGSLRGLPPQDRARSASDFFAALERADERDVGPNEMTAGDFLRAFADAD